MRPSRLVRAGGPFAAALVTVTVMALVAGAHHTDLVDPNDTRGKLDVREVRFSHPGPPLWRVLTFPEWRTVDIWDRGYIMIMLDTEAGTPAEYYLLVRSTGASLAGSLWRARNFGSDTFLGSVPVKRLSPRSISAQVGLFRLTFGEHRMFYRWWVETLFTGDRCRRTCHDRAPNQAGVVQWRPGMSPTPSPSLSPTPSASPSESPSP
jgi:hypothetical protein